jgi:hypothetical protein
VPPKVHVNSHLRAVSVSRLGLMLEMEQELSVWAAPVKCVTCASNRSQSPSCLSAPSL